MTAPQVETESNFDDIREASIQKATLIEKRALKNPLRGGLPGIKR